MTFKEVKKALGDIMNKVLAKMLNRVPVDTGNLKNSFRVVVKEVQGKITVGIESNVDYAVYVDEGTYMQGPRGTGTYLGPFQTQRSLNYAKARTHRIFTNQMGMAPRMFSKPWMDMATGQDKNFKKEIETAFKADVIAAIKINIK